MAQKVAIADGPWSTAATWNSVTNTPTLHASTNVTINATARFTATFTAPNTTNACTGVLLYITAVGTGGTVTVTLQESTVDTAASRTLNITDLVANNWVYFRFATPYVFTTTGAGAYRFKIEAASPVGTSNAAADSGGSLYCFLATDDRTGVPGATDDVWIVGQNQATAITVTMDGTQTIGNGGNTTGLSRRSITNAVTIGQGGLLVWNTAASATLTSKGNITVSGGGELRMGTVATPYPAAFVATLNFNENGTGGNYGLETYLGGKLTLQGTPKSSTSLWKTKYVSGLGTAASPLVTLDAVDWAVGDEILVCATGDNAANYNETENKFIRTKNSATSYTLADTAGGAESALANTHTTDAWILNVQRNVIIASTSITAGFYYYNENTTAGEVDIDWVRFETVGAAVGVPKEGISITTTVAGTTGNCDYSVIYRNLRRGFISGTSAATLTFTGIIACNGNSASATGAIAINQISANKTLVDCFAIKNNRVGFELNTAINTTLTRCVAISNNTVGSTTPTVTGGFAFLSTNAVTMIDCESHCNRNMSMSFTQGVTPVLATNFLSGSKGNNVIDFHLVTNAFIDATFINSTFSSTTFVTNYLNIAQGSELRFQKLNNTENNHIWYTNNGIARNSGAGLVDTTTKTVGNFALRLAAENATSGFVWEFLIGINANSAASVFGFIQKNAAFGTDLCTVELFLPGSTVADASQTMGNTTGTWMVFSMAAAYTGSVAAFARVRITAKTTTAAAYVYVADLYNGTNVLTSFKAWNEGKPSPVFTDLLGDPASVWAQLTSTFTTVGTIGYQLTNGLTTLQADTDDIQTRLPAALVGGRMDSSIGAMATDVITAAALSSGAVSEIITAIFAQMLEGLAYEEIIKDIWAQVVGDAVADDATNPTLLQYDGPDGTVQVTHTRTPTTRTKV